MHHDVGVKCCGHGVLKSPMKVAVVFLSVAGHVHHDVGVKFLFVDMASCCFTWLVYLCV